MAGKYFGNWQDAIGRTIQINNDFTVKVSGILSDVPPNTGFPLKLVISYGSGFTNRLLRSTDFDGTSSNNGCYVLLSPNTSGEVYNNALIAYSKKVKAPDNKDVQTIQPLNAVHFDTRQATTAAKPSAQS